MLLMLDRVQRAVTLALEPRSCAVADGVRAAVSYVDNPQLHAAQTLNVSICAVHVLLCGASFFVAMNNCRQQNETKQFI